MRLVRTILNSKITTILLMKGEQNKMVINLLKMMELNMNRF